MYIFLDVDGVLNTQNDWRNSLYSLNPKCVSAFGKLVKQIDNPQIVLSSTWRNGIANDGSTAVHIQELMDALADIGIHKIDKTAVSRDGNRSKEIQHYLKWHPKDLYLILDDDASLFDERTKCLYITNSLTGLTEKDIKQICKMIKR